jgi:hypothetical protein
MNEMATLDPVMAIVCVDLGRQKPHVSRADDIAPGELALPMAANVAIHSFERRFIFFGKFPQGLVIQLTTRSRVS